MCPRPPLPGNLPCRTVHQRHGVKDAEADQEGAAVRRGREVVRASPGIAPFQGANHVRFRIQVVGGPPNAHLASVWRNLHHLVAGHLFRVVGRGEAPTNPPGQFRGYPVALQQEQVVAVGKAVVPPQAGGCDIPRPTCCPSPVPGYGRRQAGWNPDHEKAGSRYPAGSRRRCRRDNANGVRSCLPCRSGRRRPRRSGRTGCTPGTRRLRGSGPIQWDGRT